MKAKDAIKLLERLDEDHEVTLDLGTYTVGVKYGGGPNHDEAVWPLYVSHLTPVHNVNTHLRMYA